MDKKTKLQNLLKTMEADTGLGTAFKSVENEMRKVASRFRREAEFQANQASKKNVQEFKKELQATLASLAESFNLLETELHNSTTKINRNLEDKVNSLGNLVSQVRNTSSNETALLNEKISNVQSDIKKLNDRKIEIPDFSKDIKNIKNEVALLIENSKIEEELEMDEFDKRIKAIQKDLEASIKKLRTDTMSAMGTQRGGGNANRNIMIAGNSSTLSRYTDINFKPGNNVTLTYTNNDNLKTTDITITSTGGGAGTSRNISTVSVSSVVAATASTDIVLIVNQGVQLTMPTAASNTNLYTIKNTSTSSVLIATTGGETIDTSSNLVLATQYTSVDLISDNSNWQIT